MRRLPKMRRCAVLALDEQEQVQRALLLRRLQFAQGEARMCRLLNTALREFMPNPPKVKHRMHQAACRYLVRRVEKAWRTFNEECVARRNH